jgi:D-3-phosphoglycerate dehydrogenase
VAQRLAAFGVTLIAYDPYIQPGRAAQLGVRLVSLDELLRESDFITIHLPKTPETVGLIGAAELATTKKGVIIVNAARGGLVDEAALADALKSGQVGAAGIDVYAKEPTTDSPLFGLPNTVVTPHLGASTTEAQDRAGVQTAEQVVAALTGGVVTNAVNIPAIPARDMEVLGPFLPLCESLGRLGMALAEGSSIDRIEAEFLGRIAEHDTRLLATSVLLGVLRGHTEEDVNLVNAPSLAEERGIEMVEAKRTMARDYTDLVRVAVTSGEDRVRVVGTTIGRRARPHLLEAWGQRFDLQLEPYVTLLRYSDVPGMVGRVGTTFGEHGINIVSAAVGRQPDDAPQDDRSLAAMAITSDRPVPQEVVDEIVAGEGFVDGRTVAL